MLPDRAAGRGRPARVLFVGLRRGRRAGCGRRRGRAAGAKYPAPPAAAARFTYGRAGPAPVCCRYRTHPAADVMPHLGPSTYRPLTDYLAAQPPEVAELTLTLAQLARILGAPLPQEVLTPDFWANVPHRWEASPQRSAWRAAGWRVARALPPAITFARAATRTLPPVAPEAG